MLNSKKVLIEIDIEAWNKFKMVARWYGRRLPYHISDVLTEYANKELKKINDKV